MNYSTLRSKWLESLDAWADVREDIRAVVVVGSLGRGENQPADEWSDVDLLFITTNPQKYTKNNTWMVEIGPFWAGVLPPGETFGDWMPVHCGFSTFEGGMNADFLILSSGRVKWSLPLIRLLNRFPSLRRWLPENLTTLGADLGYLLRNGVKILRDKDGLAENLLQVIVSIPVVPSVPPSQKKFQDNVDDFWIGPPRIAAYLRRGRLMSAMKTLELTRRDLLKMIEWHARAKEGWNDDDMAYRPTRIEAWADPRISAILPRLYANYATEEIWQALFALMELYLWLSRETADRLEYQCIAEGEKIIAWVKECHSDYLKSISPL